MEASVAQDVRRARRQSGEQAIAEAELPAERHGRRLLHEQGIGAAVDDPAVEAIGANDAAEAVGSFEQADADAAALQLVGGREAGDAGADDSDIRVVHLLDAR